VCDTVRGTYDAGSMVAKEVDPWVNLLQTHPHILEWLEEQVAGIATTARRSTRPMPDTNLAATAEFERPLFMVPVSMDAFPTDDELHALLGSMSIVPKGQKGAVVRARALESACAFYLPEEVTIDGFALGTVVATDMSSLGLAGMLGFEPSDGLRLTAARFVGSRVTGETFEIMLVQDGRVLVIHTSNMQTQFSVRMYAPRHADGRWGALLRTSHQTSLLDCARCCGVGGSRMRFCRCGDPILPDGPSGFESWFEVSKMIQSCTQDAFVLQTVHDPSGALLASLLCYRRQSIVRATKDSLPLFQALVLGNQDFLPLVEAPVFSVAALPESAMKNPYFKALAVEDKARLLLLSVTGSESDSGDGDPDDIHLLPALEDDFLGETASSSGNVTNSEGNADRAGVFECYICNRQFNARYNYKRHMNTVHADTRQFKCEECGMEFKLKNHLTVHVRQVHEGEKTHACSICSKKFWSPSNLKRHVDEAHLKVRPFSCDHCSKGFSSKFNLDRHVTKVHNQARNESLMSSPIQSTQ